MAQLNQLYNSLEKKCFKKKSGWFAVTDGSAEHIEISSFVSRVGDLDLSMERLPAVGSYTPLMAARTTDTIKYLLDLGAQINNLNSFGLTALDFHDSCVRFATMLMRIIQKYPDNQKHLKDAGLMYKSELEIVSFLRANGAKTSQEMGANDTAQIELTLPKPHKLSTMIEIDKVFIEAFLRIKCRNSITTIDADNLCLLINAVENGRALEVLENFSREKISPDEIARFSPVDDNIPYCLQELIEVGEHAYLFDLAA